MSNLARYVENSSPEGYLLNSRMSDQTLASLACLTFGSWSVRVRETAAHLRFLVADALLGQVTFPLTAACPLPHRPISLRPVFSSILRRALLPPCVAQPLSGTPRLELEQAVPIILTIPKQPPQMSAVKLKSQTACDRQY